MGAIRKDSTLDYFIIRKSASAIYYMNTVKKEITWSSKYISKKHLKSSVLRLASRWQRVRRGYHLPPHRYIKNTSTCGTTPTEHLLNAGRRPQTSQKA